MDADNKFEELKKSMFDKFLEKNPDAASFLGLHDPYDYLLPKGGSQLVFENHKLLEEFVDRMKETIDYDTLSDMNKIDWQVLEKTLKISEFEIHEKRQYELNPNAFERLGATFFLMITRDYAPLEKRIDAIVSRIEKVPQYLEEFRSRFEKSKPVQLWTEIAIEIAQQIPGLFQFIAALAKGKIPEELQNQLEQAVANLMQPLQEHLQWLQEIEDQAVENWALGKEKFDQLIQLRDFGMTSEEIYQLGLKYLKELKEERDQIAAQIAPGKTVEEVMTMIEKDAPQTFEEALDATRTSTEEAKQFLIKNDLATIFEEDKLYVEETPPYMVPLIPFAALWMPSRFDKPMIGIYVVTRPKDEKNLGKHLNYPGMRNTVVHEAFPGHFLQGAISNRSSIIHMLGQGFGSTLGSETVEGWAHYCEQMMMEQGFVAGPEAKLIQIIEGIWRAVRIIIDIKLSREEMSLDEATEMLMKEAGMSKEGAVAEVRRYTQTPSYPLSYLLGKHLILQLRDEVKQKMGAEYTDKFFHDTMTANGYLPVSLIRTLFDQKITKLKS